MQTDGEECLKNVEDNRFNKKTAENKTWFDPRKKHKTTCTSKESLLEYLELVFELKHRGST